MMQKYHLFLKRMDVDNEKLSMENLCYLMSIFPIIYDTMFYLSLT